MTEFVKKEIMQSYVIKGHKIDLQLDPDVFSPSEQGIQLAQYIKVQPHERVLDMGTGTGIQGIVAGKQGGLVDVSDTSAKAVHLASNNAAMNGVSIAGYVGEYFCTTHQDYDYIIANLPQEIIPANYAKEIGSLEKTISGGQNGNEHLLRFLDEAIYFMHGNSRALIAVSTLTDYIESLQKIKSLYAPKLLDVISSPAKQFVQDDIEFYRNLMNRGKIGLFQKDGLWQSTIFIYELKKKLGK
jgi:release factor glutamine methyltransferase